MDLSSALACNMNEIEVVLGKNAIKLTSLVLISVRWSKKGFSLPGGQSSGSDYLIMSA